MAKMAFFDGNSFLSSAYDIFAGVGSGEWRVTFNAKLLSVNNCDILSVNDNIIYASQRIVAYDFWRVVKVAYILTPYSDFTYGQIDGANNVQLFNIYSTPDVIKIEVDGVSLEDGPWSNSISWDLHSTALASEGTWAIGRGLETGTISSTGPFLGFISNFKVYHGETLVLHLPLTEDFVDISGNAIDMTNNGISFIDADLVKSVASGALNGVINVNDSWMLSADAEVTLGFVGNAVTSLATKAGFAVYYTLPATIPMGTVLPSGYAKIYLQAVNSGYPTGSGTKARVTGEKNAAAVPLASLADYQARRGTIVGGADDTRITTANVTFDDITTTPTIFEAIDVTSVLQEIVNLGDTTSVLFFVDDHEGRSTADHLYGFELASALVLTEASEPPSTFIPSPMIF